MLPTFPRTADKGHDSAIARRNWIDMLNVVLCMLQKRKSSSNNVGTSSFLKCPEGKDSTSPRDPQLLEEKPMYL